MAVTDILESQRIVDPLLTEMAVQYRNSRFIGENLFPVVSVQKEAGKVPIFGREDFRIYNTIRGLRARSRRIETEMRTQTYYCDEYSLESAIDDREMANWNSGLGSIEDHRTIKLMNALLLQKEKACADLAFDDSNYNSDLVLELDGSAGKKYWSNSTDGDPILNIETIIEEVRSKIGIRPNTIVVGESVWTKMKRCAKIKSYFTYTGEILSVTERMIEQILSTKENPVSFHVGGGLYLPDSVDDDGDAEFSDLWGNYCVVAYVPKGKQSNYNDPAFGYSYRVGDSMQVERYRDESIKSNIINLSFLEVPQISAKDESDLAIAGGIITNCLS